MQALAVEGWSSCVDECLSDSLDFQKNKDFRRVIQQLKETLTEKCVSKPQEASFEKLNAALHAQRRKYFKSKLLYDALHDIARDRLRTSLDVDTLDLLLQQVEAELSESEFDEALRQDEMVERQSELQKLHKLVPVDLEQRIGALCSSVSRFYTAVSGTFQHCDGTESRCESDLAKLVEHNESAIRDEQELKQMRNETNALRARRDVLQRRYVDALNGLVHEHGGSLSAQTATLQTALVEANVARCEALASKISLIQQRVIAGTYDDRAVAALKQIRLELDAEKLKLDSEKRRMQDTLARYAQNRGLFEALAEEQRRLKKQISDLEPAIQKLI